MLSPDAENNQVVINFSYDLPDGTIEKTSLGFSPTVRREDVVKAIKSYVWSRRVEAKISELKEYEGMDLEA